MSGRDADPILISLREAYVPSKQRDLKVSRRNMLSDSRPTVAPGATRPGASTPAASANTATPSSSLPGAGVRAQQSAVVLGSPGVPRVPALFLVPLSRRLLPGGRFREGYSSMTPDRPSCPCRRLGSWRR